MLRGAGQRLRLGVLARPLALPPCTPTSLRCSSCIKLQIKSPVSGARNYAAESRPPGPEESNKDKAAEPSQPEPSRSLGRDNLETEVQRMILAHPHGFTREDAQLLLESVRRITRRNTLILRWAVIVLGLVGCGVLIFWEDIKPFLGQQTAEVATLTLEDEVVQVKVGEFAKELLSQLISHYSTDEETRRLTVDFVRAILSDPNTSLAVRQLVTSVLEDAQVRGHINRLAKDTTIWVLNDPYVNEQVVQLIARIGSWKETQQILVQLTSTVINDPYTWQQLVSLTQRTLAAEQVQSQANQVAAGSVHWVLNNEEINARAQKFIEDTLSNERVKESAGYALWDAIKIAFTPSIFRARVHRPEKRHIAEADPTPTAMMPVDKSLSVPDEKLQGTAEILFREAYEKINAKYGLAVTPQALNTKKREFELELATRKATLAPSLRRAFTELSNEYQEAVFQQDQQLIDVGGEEALLLRGRAKIDAKIGLIHDYLGGMEKFNRGYLWSAYTEEQEVERKELAERISELQKEKAEALKIVEQEKEALMQRNPIAHFRTGTLQAYLKGEQPPVQSAPASTPAVAPISAAPSSSQAPKEKKLKERKEEGPRVLAPYRPAVVVPAPQPSQPPQPSTPSVAPTAPEAPVLPAAAPSAPQPQPEPSLPTPASDASPPQSPAPSTEAPSSPPSPSGEEKKAE